MIYDVDLDDGRTVTLEADNPPSEQDIYAALQSYQPPAPRPQLQPGDLAGPEARQIPDLTTTTRGGPPAKLASFAETIQEPLALAPEMVVHEGITLPGLSDTIKKAGEQYIGGLGIRGVSTPTPPEQFTPAQKLASGAIQGVDELVEGVANFLSSSQGITETGAAASPLAPAVYLKWANDMVRGGMLNAGEAYDAYKRGDWETFAKQVTGGLGMLLGAGAVTKHGVGKIAEPIQAFTGGTPRLEEANAKALAATIPPEKVSIDTGGKVNELRLEGMSLRDAMDLVSGKQSPEQVVEKNYQKMVSPAWNANVSQVQGGHGEAMIAGYNLAIERIKNILGEEPITKTGETYASPIRSDTGQILEAGQIPETSENVSGQNLQLAPPGQPEPVVPRVEQRPQAEVLPPIEPPKVGPIAETTKSLTGKKLRARFRELYDNMDVQKQADILGEIGADVDENGRFYSINRDGQREYWTGEPLVNAEREFIQRAEASTPSASPSETAAVTETPISSEPSPPSVAPVERLLIKPRTDGLVTLEDSKGQRLGTFKNADEAAKTAADLGYKIVPGSPLKPTDPPPTTPKIEAKAKEPWEMTKAEYSKFYYDNPKERERIGNFPKTEHARNVRVALEQGKPVPAHVLKEYPDLVKKLPSLRTRPEGGLTPMMQQYQRIKEQLVKEGHDALLAFRLGDFYEFFFDDAKSAAQLLKLSLTKRSGVDMAGIPYHAAQGYFGKLVSAGKKVAVVDQSEMPKPGKLVERKVTEILEPKPTPAETPPQAAAKVREEVKQVAKTEGQRPAKEIKADYLQRVEDEIKKVIQESESTIELRGEEYPNDWIARSKTSGAYGTIEKVGNKFKVSAQRPGYNLKSATFNSLEEAQWFIKGLAAEADGKVTINIPGDGDTTIVRSGEHMIDLWKKVKSLDTRSETPSRTSSVGNTPTPEKVIAAYGTPEEAYNTIVRQARSLEDATERKDALRFAYEIYKSTKAAQLEGKAEAARQTASDRRSEMKESQDEIDRINKLKKRTKAHAESLEYLIKRAASAKERMEFFERSAKDFEEQATKEKLKLEQADEPTPPPADERGD